jgi:predicted AlkP superfamily pyrophosphatase or phosphodiesterase
MVGSSTAPVERGAVQAILDNPRTDWIHFYKNLNRSLVADEDDAFHVYARRCGVRTTLTEDCDPEDVVFDHVVFTRTATTAGGFTYEVTNVTAERPVGTDAGIAGVNPFGAPHVPGPVVVADADDPRRDPSALDSPAAQIDAATRMVTETEPASEAGVERFFIPPEHATYPYPYERLAAELDDADAPDIVVSPVPSGDPGVRGGHGALDVTQSRATLVVSGRGARRTPLDPAAERALAIKHVDVAPTVAKVLGVPVNAVGRLLNGGTQAENPSAAAPMLLRQDGKPLDALLEPRINTFVVVLDGMLPENLTPEQTPSICNLIGCPGAAAPDPSARATVYTAARATMVSQTNANHTAMLTGAYGAGHGIVANTFFNRVTMAAEPLESPSLIRVDTLFDVLRREAPHLKTAAVLGKHKLRELYDCTNDGAGTCVIGSTANPEGVPVTHVRPDFLRGAAVSPVAGSDDCVAEPASGSGVAEDACIMDAVIRLSATEDPDFTFVNLGTIDGLQHVLGPNSPVTMAAVTLADQQVGRLVAYLKDAGKWQDSVLLLVADHSFSWQGPDPTHRVDLATLFGADLEIQATGESFEVVSSGGTAQVYLTGIGVGATALTPAQATALARMREIALAQPGVSDALYRLENPLDPGETLAARRPAWNLADQRIGDLVVTALASGPTAGLVNPTAPGSGPFEVASGAGFTLAPLASATGALQGDHGHPGARHIPFIIVSGGDHVVDQTIAASGTVNEGDDTAANPEQAESVDVAPTVAWIYGLDPATVLPDADGRALTEAFGGVPIEEAEPHANRALIVIFDGNNSVRIHDLMADCLREPGGGFACGDPDNRAMPSVRSLVLRDTDARLDVPQGTLTRFGSIAGFPSVTFPNHNVVGSGAYPGHHGIVGNRYYERDVEIERDPIDPLDPRNPVFFFSSALLRHDFETLHEAVHRAFGDWAPVAEDPGCNPATDVCNGPSGAFTASVNEPSARGADFASLETVSSDTLPATFAFLTASSLDFVADTDATCAGQSLAGYGQESILDHLGQAQARALYTEPSTGGLPPIPGVDPLVIDDTGGAAHPDPKYMIANFTLTDGAGHEFGPHGNCARAGYGDTGSRFQRILDALADHERFALAGEPARLGETLIVLTGDHGMEDQDQASGPGHDGELAASDIEYIDQDGVYLLTLRVELVGAPDGVIPPGTPTLTFRVTDGDLDATGAGRPVAGAVVEAVSGAEQQSATTGANGEVTFTFGVPVDTVALRVDKDASPTMGTRTLGSTSQDPGQHGQVVKADFNELRATFSTPTPSLCPAAPANGCRRGVVPLTSRFDVKVKSPATRSRLLWKWSAGEATAKSAFGDPRTTTDYELCAYDGNDELLTHAAMPAGEICDPARNKPCWRETKRGFRYIDRALTPHGIKSLDLAEGIDGKARIVVKGKGALLDLPPLPIASLPVRVQIVNDLGGCWESIFSSSLKNDGERFLAKGE